MNKKKNVNKRLGIIGGMGPETSSKFYLELIERSRKFCDSNPSIIMDSVPIPFSLEEEIIQKSENVHKFLPILKESIERLNKIEVDLVVIPCNTVHIFIDDLRKESDVPIISIIEETLRKVKEEGLKNVGLLATKKTIESKLYENPMRKNRINVILSTVVEQNDISRIIIEILGNKAKNNSKKILERIIKNLIKRGSEAIILGCTDLQIILDTDEFEVELLDSMKILAESTFQRLVDFER